MTARPVLYGDGLHDDTAAVRALLEGREVECARTGKIIRPVSQEGHGG